MRFSFVFFILCSLLAFVISAPVSGCPGQCSSHGTCQDGTCVCQPDYSGNDCSYHDREIHSGDVFSSQLVNTYSWDYYHLALTTTSTINIILNETTARSDCDIYVQRNSYPTQTTYQYNDISTRPHVQMTIPQASFGTWYIGVYGFSSCSYNFQVIVSGCPNSCSSHGTCVNNVCQCDPDYFSDDCSKHEPRLSTDQAATGSLTKFEWAYYYFDLSSTADRLIFQVSETGDHQDIDLYVKKNSRPSLWDWDFMNATVSANNTIVIPNPDVNVRYHIGVFGFTAAGYILTARVDTPSGNCPGQCSRHGTCSGSICQCSPNFSGTRCETMNLYLTNEQTVSGFADTGFWNYYSYQSSSQNPFVISMTQTSTERNSDCDLYVRQGAQPTRFHYDYNNLSTLNSVNLTIPTPMTNVWYIGVYGWTACAYDLVIHQTSSSSCPCVAGHGSCAPSSSVCSCAANWCGDDCSVACPSILSTQQVTGSVSTNTWSFYTFETTSSSVEIVTKELNSVGYINTYVAIGTSPSLIHYDYSESSTSNSFHSIHIDFASPIHNTYYIGVYGNVYLPSSQTANFSLSVFATTF